MVAFVIWAVVRAIITDKVGPNPFGLIGVGVFLLIVFAVIFHYSGKPEDSPLSSRWGHQTDIPAKGESHFASVVIAPRTQRT
ncbi:hypothetical protein ACVBEQ_25030 [Nakamurella sp. GG22]